MGRAFLFLVRGPAVRSRVRGGMGERLTGAAGDNLQIFAALARAGSSGLYFHERRSPWAEEFVEHDAHPFIKRWALLHQL